MASEFPLVIFDNNNPEWTDADAKCARLIAEFPKIGEGILNGSKPRGRLISTRR